MSENSSKKLKVNDRVRRVIGGGCIGTVKDLRVESVISSAEPKDKEKQLMVVVLWDNGTQAYHGVEALEVVKG